MAKARRDGELIGKPPGESRARRTTQDLLTRAEEPVGTGSFERNLRTGETEYSPGLRRIYGFSTRAKVTWEKLLARVHPEDRSLIEEALAEATRERQPFEF